MNRPVVVTGASGFVGAHLAIGLAKKQFHVLALGGNNEVPQLVRNSVPAVYNLDLTRREKVLDFLATCKPFGVIHCAALARPERCEAEIQLSYELNVQASRNLLDACLSMKKLRPFFVYVSSDMVFDGADAPPGGFRELHEPQPRSVYARHKLLAEKLLVESELDGLVLRVALVYGEKVEHLEGFISWMRRGLVRNEMSLFGDEYRTPVWTEDIIRAVSRVLEMKEHFRENALRVLHLGGNQRLSRFEMGEILANALQINPNVIRCVKRTEVPSLYRRPYDISLCSDELQMRLGITLSRFQDAIASMNVHSAD